MTGARFGRGDRSGRVFPPGRGRARLVLAGLFFCVVLLPAFGSAEEFWSERHAEGFVLHFHASDQAVAGTLLRDLVASRKEVARELGVDGGETIAVYLADSESEFRALSRGRIPHWGVGCAFPEESVILLRRLPGQYNELVRTARHEICHILLDRAVTGRLPVWFNEGVAMWAAQQWQMSQSAEVFYAVLSGGLIPLSKIDQVLSFSSPRAHLAYTQSLLAITYLIHLGGPDAVARIVSEMMTGAPFDVALFRVTGYTPARFEKTWAAYVRGRFSVTAAMVQPEAIWVYMTLLVLAAYLAVRIRNRQRTRRWEDEDPAEALPMRLRLQVRRREDQP